MYAWLASTHTCSSEKGAETSAAALKAAGGLDGARDQVCPSLRKGKKGRIAYVEAKPNLPTSPSPCGWLFAACRSQAKQRPSGRRRKTAKAPLRSSRSTSPTYLLPTQSQQGASQEARRRVCLPVVWLRWIPIPQAPPKQGQCRARQFASRKASRRRPCS